MRMKKKITILEGEFSQDKYGINLILSYPNLTHVQNKFNKGTEKILYTILQNKRQRWLPAPPPPPPPIIFER